MPLQTANWDTDKNLPVGKGATSQQFFTTLGKDRFEISVAPWGEGQLKVNDREVARTAEAKDRRQAFALLKDAAERYARGEAKGGGVGRAGEGKGPPSGVRLLKSPRRPLRARRADGRLDKRQGPPHTS